MIKTTGFPSVMRLDPPPGVLRACPIGPGCLPNSYHLFLMHRQRELKDRTNGSSSGVAHRRPSCASMIPRLTAQSHAHSFPLGGIQRIEDVMGILGSSPEPESRMVRRMRFDTLFLGA